MAGVIPRLLVIGFKYVQPFMIRRMVVWLDEAPRPNLHNEGYGLLAAFAIAFIGLAVRRCLPDCPLCLTVSCSFPMLDISIYPTAW